MNTKPISLLEKWASWKSVLLFFALQMLFSIVIMPAASGSDAHDLPILDLQFFYTPEQAYEIIGAYTPSMRQAAAVTRLTLDVVYPLVYGMLLSLLLVLTFRRAFGKDSDFARRVTARRRNLKEYKTASSQVHAPRGFIYDWVIFLPWGGVLFDYLENVGFAVMFLSYPKEYYFLAQVSAVFTALKWTLIGAGFVLALIGGVKLAFLKKEIERG